MKYINKIRMAINALKRIYSIETIVREMQISQNYFMDTQLKDIVLERHKRKYGVCSESARGNLVSSICRMQDLIGCSDLVSKMGKYLAHPHLPESTCVMNRKGWEYVFITQALLERGMLTEGKRGLGFAVGKEPLPALFASYGCEVVATDLDSSTQTAKSWTSSNQHAESLEDLYKPELCSKDIFYQNVSYDFLDMNNISTKFKDFDFCWSSCAFEHLGSVEKGKKFIYNMLDCLRPGGIAVHTTEYNVSNPVSVMTSGGDVIWGQFDLKELRDEILAQSHIFEDFDFRLGDYDEEDFISVYPHENPHFKLLIDRTVSTSIAIIIQKCK